MADREERKIEASKHSALMKGALGEETQASVEATVIYEEGQGRELPVPEPSFDATETIVTGAFEPMAMYRHASGKTVVVDPASFARPGGAYEDGAFGPSRSCARKAISIRFCAASRTSITAGTAIIAAAACSPTAWHTCRAWCFRTTAPCARPT